MKNSILGIFSYSNNLDGTKWKITSSENHFTQMIGMKKKQYGVNTLSITIIQVYIPIPIWHKWLSQIMIFLIK